jgi:hypothetical protein
MVPQVGSQGVLHSTASAALETSHVAHVYGMLTGYYPGQSPLPKRTPVKLSPQASSTALSGQMVMVPDQPLPLSVVPSTLVRVRIMRMVLFHQCIAQ